VPEISISGFTQSLPDGVIGFATGTRLLEFFIVEGGSCLDRNCKALDLEPAYDVCAYAEDTQWHWRWDQRQRRGESSQLDDGVAASNGWHRLSKQQFRLLRGRVIDKAGGWSLLHDAVTRPLWVPIAADKRSLVRIGVVEYLAEDDHGNVGVVAERLTGLSEVKVNG